MRFFCSPTTHTSQSAFWVGLCLCILLSWMACGTIPPSNQEKQLEDGLTVILADATEMSTDPHDASTEHSGDVTPTDHALPPEPHPSDATTEPSNPPDATNQDDQPPDRAVSDTSSQDRDMPETPPQENRPPETSTPPDAAKPDTKPPSPCLSIRPDPGGSAAANHKTIQDCLNQEKIARLTPGTYPIANGLVVPPSGQLLGDTTYPRLILQPSATGNFMVTFSGDSPATQKARIGFLKLDANNVLGGRPNASIVHFRTNSRLDNSHVYNNTMPPTGKKATGVYVICGPCSGIEIVNNKIYNSFYGAIFGPKNTSAHKNIIEQNHIYDTKCDGITFVSYGIAKNNTLYQNGFDCENGPIPGASIYALDNKNGGELIGNTMYDTCGHVIDIDNSENFIIQNNHAYNPGHRWNGKYNYCGGASAAFLLDVSKFTITGNTFENNRSWNNSSDPNQVMRAVGAGALADLPFGTKTIIAFVLAKRPNSTANTIGNSIENNKMRANCSGGGCGGLGYFTSRGTGYRGTAWDAGTTNYFRGNDPFGSQVGSKRCGGNWYAANSTCNQGSGPPCNVDDYQHNTPTGDWARNDKCSFYR